MDDRIKKSYDKITPTDSNKKEILLKIQNSKKENAKSNGFSLVGKEFYMKKAVAAVVIALCVLSVSTGVYATYRWLTGKQVASELGDQKLAKYFDKSEEEIKIQEQGKYKVAFLGMVSGKNISDNLSDDTVDAQMDYFVTAVEHKDGTPMSDEEDVVASPFVQGVSPMEFNIYSMKESCARGIRKDGVVYLLTECQDVEIFADRKVYLAVMDGPNMGQGYRMDEETGEITRNEKFEGLNVLFELALDAGKADKEVAQKYLDQVRKEMETTEDEQNSAEPKDDLENLEEALKEAEVVTGSRKALRPGADGSLNYETKEIYFSTDADFVKKNGTQIMTCYGEENEQDCIVVFSYENGTYYGELYLCDKEILKKYEKKRRNGKEIK